MLSLSVVSPSVISGKQCAFLLWKITCNVATVSEVYGIRGTKRISARDHDEQEIRRGEGEERREKCHVLSVIAGLDAMLNMVAGGSKGDTSKQLLHFLGSSNLEDVNSKSSGMMRIALNEKSLGSPDITFVNGVWVDQRFPVKPSYMEVLNGIFKAETRNVDFLNKADQATHEINSWAETATKGLIRTMIPHGALDSETMIVLANALYFKGAWACKFDSSMTQEKNFHLLNGESTSVAFMTSDLRETRYAYGTFDASRFMTGLGLTSPFEPVKELTGIVDSPRGDELFISDILHKACIEVDEEGTEAAAVTRSVMCGCARGYVPPPPPTFVADHPFMFLIKEQTAGAMLLVGALLNPAS
ncbi:hypothetical protein RJ639_027627 [Escallonia herrerae]|uniref:Serpin domain-containing protein n=1 Tax=Escallonia herrerae TaxID=1293975 RepID=A0AA88X3S9_9ASTE|nr:hypothetical protein RJ639_027627 [Escallonia herrerae]